MIYPTASEVLAVRKAAGWTQQQSAESIGQGNSSAWRRYEAGTVKMHPSSWELFLLKTGQHPALRLVAI